MTAALPTIAGGALIGIVLCYAMNDQPVTALVLAAAALGSVLATALRQAIGGKV